ncbi:MAG: alkaline phosphatase family protein [Actinomycetota bacterium]
MRKHMAKGRVFIIGIDGGTWKVMSPLMEAGRMPALRALASEGRHGVLASTIPYITCPAWNTLASGRNPGWIGAFGFLNLAPASYALSYYDYHRDPALPEIWDILGERGLSCGAFNIPVVREPRRINGYMIPGFLADERDLHTWPASMRAAIDAAAGGYVIEPKGFSVMGPEKTIRECEAAMDKRHRVFEALLSGHPCDFFLGVFHLADRVSHNLLNHTGLPLEPERGGLHALTAAFFEKLDGHIGALVERYVGASDLLMVLSDHGFAPCKSGFLLNNWLIGEGYLKVRSLGGLSGMGINQKRIAAALDRVGLLAAASRYAPRSLRRMVPEGRGSGSHASVVDYIQADRVDWAATRAIALPNHGIYLNTSDRPRGSVGVGGERESLIKELRRGLEGYVDVASGERPVSAVRSREEIYSGPKVDWAPDLMVEMVEGWTTQGVIGDEGRLVLPLTRADHRREGMIVLRGPGIDAGAGDGSIEDIAPTVLDFMGVEGPPAMDGKSLL